MIGAIMARSQSRAAFDLLSNRDVAKATANYTPETVWHFPGHTPISGEFKGKQAIVEAFNKWMGQFPKIKFIVREVFVSNIFAMSGTNNVAIEWDSVEINAVGKEFPNSGVTIVRVKGGKVVDMKDYMFDHDGLNESWKAV